MESYGNDMFLSQEGYPSIDFTLLDRPSTSISSAPESTAALLPDSSFPSFDFLDGSGVEFGGVLRTAQEAHFRDQGRSGLQSFQEKTLHASSADMYRQGGGNQEPKLSSPQFHIPVSQVDFFSTKESGSDDLQAQLSTSGNEVADEVHDFFEQEHLSQQQSQLGRGNWSVLNNNAWLPAGSNPNVIKSQPRNQPLTLDGLLNGPPAGQPRANQATSAGDAGTPEQHQSSAGSLAGPDTQQVNITGQGSNHSRNSSEGLENIEAPVNYDFLGSQLHLKGQPQAGVQHHGARQQPVLDEMQIWKQQQYSYQHHLHELHRQQQAQQLEQHARQQQAQQLEQHARQQQVRQLEQQVRQQQAQQLEQQARQQQAQQLEQRARQQQVQQLEQQARQQQVQLEQHARQQHQLQQLLVSEKQNLGNQFSTSLYGSSIHDGSNFMRPGGMMAQMGIESQNPSLLSANFQPFNVGNMNWMPNGSPSLPGYPTELLLSQDPNLAWQALAFMGTHLDPSVYGSSISNLRDSAGQPLNLYPSAQGAVQELADATNKAASATSHQVGKPVARTVGLGVSILGDQRAISFDPVSAQNDDSSGKQQALCKSLFGQSFPQNFLQPTENNRGLSNYPQGTSVPRNLQLQEFHVKQQQRSWNDDAGHKDNFQVGPSHVFANSDAPSENVFYNSQQSGWQSARSSQAVGGSDARAQSINAGQYVNQGGCQMESSEFLSNLASKQRGTWSALMQSALADSSTADAEQQDDWNSVHLQKSEPACVDSLQLLPTAKQQSIWGEQNVQASTSLNGRSFHLFNEVNARPGVQSVQNLQQTNSELGTHFGSKQETIQHNNQNRLQSAGSSQFLQEAAGQASGLQNQSLHQHPQVASNLQPYSNIEDRLQRSWKTQNAEQVPSEGRASSSHAMHFNATQQNSSWRHHQGNSEPESYRLSNLASNDQSCWNKNEAQGTEQNNLLLNANQRSQKHDNENAMHLENEHLGSLVYNAEEQNHQARYHRDKDTATSVQHQDAKLKACQSDQTVHQEIFRMGIFPQNMSASNSQNNSERHRQMTESNYQLDGSMNAMLDCSTKNKGIESASIYQQSNSSQAWNSYPSNSDNAASEYGMSRAKYGQNDSMTADQIAAKVDPNQQNAKAGSDHPRNSPQRESDLQSVGNVNQRGQSRLSRMSIGSVGNSYNELLSMPSRQIFQQPVGSVSVNQWHTESPKQDPSLRGVSHMDTQGQKAPEHMDFGKPNMVVTLSSSSPLNIEKDVPSTKSSIDLKERPEVGHLKDISSGYVSASSAAVNRSTNFVGVNKPTSLSSQNILELLNKPDHLSESDALKGGVCSEQDAPVGPCESSAADISLAHFRRTQSSNPLSPQGFGLRLAPPSQLLQILQHGRSLQLNSFSQEAKGLNDKQTYPSKEDLGRACSASVAGQDSSSKVMEPPAKADGLSRSSSVTTLAQQLSSRELSSTIQNDRVVDGMENSSDIGASTMHPLKSSLQYMDHTSAGTGQLMSTTQTPNPRAVIQRQIMHGNYIPCTNQLQGSPGVSVSGQSPGTCQVVAPSTVSCVNSVMERESEMQGTFSPMTRSFSQIGYSSDLHAQDGLGQNHHSMSGNHNLSVVRNGEQGLQESRPITISQPLGMSGISQTASFSKLLNNFKTNLVNQPTMTVGAEKVFPSVFESFRPPVGGSGNNVQSFLPRSDGQLKLSAVGKPTASMRGQPYRPCIINSQQPVSAEELLKQENSFEQKVSDKVGSSGVPAQQPSTRALPVTMPTLLVQTSATSPQLSMLQSQGQEQRKFLMAKIHSVPSAAVASPLQSVLHTYNQEQTRPAGGQDSRSLCPPEKQQSDSCSDGPVVSQASEPSDPPRQQYLLSDRMLSASMMQNDADNKAVKRLKIADAMGSGNGSSFKGKASEQTIYPHNLQEQARVVTASSTAWQQDSLSTDIRMLPLPSQGSKERSEAAANQSIAAIMQGRLQQGYNHIIYGSSQSSSAGSDPQLANSRLLQFGTNTNEQLMALQVAAMYKRFGGSGRSAMVPSQQFLPGRNAESLFPGTGLVPNVTGHITQPVVKDAGPITTVINSMVATLAHTDDHPAHQHPLFKSNIRPPPTVLSKKRKKAVSRLTPWYIEITQTGGWLPTTSDAELAWASATNRLAEKEEDEIDTYEEGTGSVTRVKRRLKLTTQLMQQLIPPLPAAIIRGKANVEHENATYTLAKTALGDACKLISNLRKDMVPGRGNEAENENLAFGQLHKSKRLKGNSILRIVEGFMDRAKSLDNELLRLEASISVTELRSETQDLERVSIMNRLVKHHGRNIPVDSAKATTEERESSSESALCTRKQCPQRYVTAVPMPRNLPEGVLCYSL